MSRLPLLPPAIVLTLYAAWAGREATRLPHVGAPTLFGAAMVLLAAALALVAGRQLWSYVFALLFFMTTTLGYGALAVVVGWEALTHTSGGEWAGVRRLVMGLIAVVGLALGLISGAQVAILGVGGRGVAASRSALAWAVSSVAALAGAALLAWLVGYQYWYRQLPARNECLAGMGARCYGLVYASDRFTKAERQAFARIGCEAGDDSACRALAAFLDASHPVGSPEVRALDARCRAGHLEQCRRLGAHLLATGDGEGGRRALQTACALDARSCERVARTAQEAGQEDFSRRLLEEGCGREDPASCRSLLHRRPGLLPPEERAALELKTCLIGDINDCLPLVRRDRHGVCRLICAGTTESRMHSCGRCASEAVAAGEPELAEEWLAGTCGRGYRWGCTELTRLREQPVRIQR
jgi:hypothetical protein